MATVSAAVMLVSGSVFTQAPAEPNSQPNPYKLVMNWAQLPPDMKWGQVIAFDVDRDGNIYGFHRNDPGILKFSPGGRLLKSWGEGAGSVEILRHEVRTALGLFVDGEELQQARMIKLTTNLRLSQGLDASQMARRHFHRDGIGRLP